MQSIQPLLAIASNSFLEAIRDKILYAFIFFAFFLTLLSFVISMLSSGQDLQVLIDFGLFIIGFIGGIITIFAGTSLVYKEIEKRTIYLIVTKPVSRWQFVAGKYLGLSAALMTVTVAMGSFLCLTVFFLTKNHTLAMPLLESLALMYLEFLFLNAVATFFSTFATPLMSVLFTLSVWLMAHYEHSLMVLSKLSKNQVTACLIDSIYWGFPDLERLTQVRSDIIYGIRPETSLIVYLVLYLVAYILLLLLLASLITEQREFP